MATAKTTAIKKPQSALLRPIGAFFRRFHLLMFFILIVGCLAVAVTLINKALTEPLDSSYTSSINAGSIDESTLKRIQALHASSQPTTPTLPTGRINPFAE